MRFEAQRRISMSSVAVDAPHARTIEFSIRRILCAVDLTPSASLAAELAVTEDATLTLVHIGGGEGHGSIRESHILLLSV
jgi:hypothetical protein